MGREIKRVPLTFDWPKDKVWNGFLNPHYSGHCSNCLHCDGTGSSPEARYLHDKWYGKVEFHPSENGSIPFTPESKAIRYLAERNVNRAPEYYGVGEPPIQREARRLADLMNAGMSHHLNQQDVEVLLKKDSLRDVVDSKLPVEFRKARHAMPNRYQLKRLPISRKRRMKMLKRMRRLYNTVWLQRKFQFQITAQEVNEWSVTGFGHDCCNQWAVCAARLKVDGIKSTCDYCNGEGSVWDSEENKKICEAWQRSEPPKGDGYQLWETVSEGSPISPVFVKPEELAAWLVSSTDYTWARNDRGTTYEQWLRFICGPGWAPSLIVDNKGVHTGVQAVV